MSRLASLTRVVRDLPRRNVVAGASVLVVAALVTGVPDAYLQTELAWWRLHLDVHHFAPLTPWFLQADRFAGTLGVVAVLVAVGATGWWLSSRSTRRIGSVPLLGSASYLLSLFATFLPQQSLPRLLLPAAPLLGAPLLHRTALRRGIVLGGCVLAQPAAVWVLFLTHNP